MPPPGPDSRRGPAAILVVGWYPAADAPVSGRFVADQVAALHATGAVRPSVLAFENAAVRGPGDLRERQAAAIGANVAASLRAASPFVDGGAAGAPSAPLARLSVAAGPTPRAPEDHRAVHRIAAVESLLAAGTASPWAIVHGHVGYPEGAAAAAAAARLGTPLIITEHASFLSSLLAEPAALDRYRRTMRAADRVIAVSAMLAREVEDLVPGLDRPILVIPNAVAVDEFAARGTAERRRGEMLFVGGRLPTKGIATLIEAFALVQQQRPAATLRLVGPPAPGEGDARWLEHARRLGVSDSVTFEPATDRRGVVAAMERADVFVHPSPRETFGVVAVEALAAGLPVVAADSGGVTEIMGEDPDELGAVVPANDAAALAAGIVRTLARRASFDPGRLRSQVVPRFAADRVAGRIVEVYGEVLAETPRTRGGPSRATTPRRGTGGAPPPHVAGRRTIVVGFSRLEIDRALRRFPVGLFDAVTIVTSGAPLAGRGSARLAPPGVAEAVHEVLGWGSRSEGSAARGIARLRRVVGRFWPRFAAPSPATVARLLAQLSTTLDAELRADDGSAAGAPPPLVLCVAGIDHLIAAPFIAAGRAIAAPGGLRWLADARSAQGAATAASRSPSSDA